MHLIIWFSIRIEQKVSSLRLYEMRVLEYYVENCNSDSYAW